tara:strand:- start:9 stop:212 length:204 start_codon:yes stop_codon:yes gene_type:complete
MKLYVAIDEYNNVYAYTSKKKMLSEANANEWEVHEPIIFDLTKTGVIEAMRNLTFYCGNTAEIKIGN